MLEKMKKGKTNNTWAMVCCPRNIVMFLSKKFPFNVKSGMLSVVFEARKTFMEGLSCKIDDFFTLQIDCSLSPAYMCHPSWKLTICTPKSHIPHHTQGFSFSILWCSHSRNHSQEEREPNSATGQRGRLYFLELCYVLDNIQEPSAKIWQLPFLFSSECGQLKGI